MGSTDIAGRFWITGENGPHRDGLLRLAKEAPPSLEVQGALTSMMELAGTSTSPSGSTTYCYYPIHDLALRTVHGESDTGTPLTLLEAQNRSYHGGFLPAQQVERLEASHAVVGGYLSGRDHQFSGARVRLQTVRALLSSRHERWAACTALANGGSLHLEEDSEGTWIVLQDLPGTSIRGLDRRFLRPLSSLLSLATCEWVGLMGLEVQERPVGPWWPVHSVAHRCSDLGPPNMPLLKGSDLAPTSVAAWLNQVETLGPLPPVVVGALRGPILLESRLLELATVAEGLHRRLRPEVTRFSQATGAAIRDAAVAAALTVEPGSVDAVRGMLQYVHEPGYGQRLLHLAEIAEPLAPGVTGKTNRWKTLVYDGRNDFAHRDRARNGWLDDTDVDRYLTAALSLQWLLHALMLGQAGIPSDVLAQRFREHQPYRLFLEQARTWQPRIYT